MITELTVGGLIFHVMSLEPAIPDTMVAPNFIFKVKEHNFLIGENSVRQPIVGYGYDFNLVDHANGSIDFKLGAYIQDEKPFRDRGIKLAFDSFMPIMGFEFDLPINKNVAVTTTITPLMTFTGVTFKF
tara:strand:+ start:243 stop:629 length:387 start_codon:yes stop_codon:yes gene_type:complete